MTLFEICLNWATDKNLSEAISTITTSGYFDEKEESEESDEAAEEQEEVQEEAQDVAEDVQDTPVDPVVEEVSQPTVEDVQRTEVGEIRREMLLNSKNAQLESLPRAVCGLKHRLARWTICIMD